MHQPELDYDFFSMILMSPKQSYNSRISEMCSNNKSKIGHLLFNHSIYSHCNYILYTLHIIILYC